MAGLAVKLSIIAARNAPLLLGVYAGLRQQSWGLAERALCLMLAAACSAALISWSERWLDSLREGAAFNWKEFAVNASLFWLFGLALYWYFQRGGYGADLVVGGGLALLLAGSQYFMLGEQFFFTKRKALAFYGAGLALVVPAVLVALRYSLALPAAPALAVVAAAAVLPAPVLLYVNYMQDG
ncbi:MAG TPA: hypothetical protein VGE07_25930 [Herpetosiphonaceae bacterium]